MKTIMQWVFASTVTRVLAQWAEGQATITGPSTWPARQPTTVTWTASAQASPCAAGVRVVMNLSNTQILTGNAVALSAGRAAIPAVTLTAGTPVTLTLKEMCTGRIVSSAHAVSITDSPAAAPTPVAAALISQQVRQNIDSACQGVLGSTCSNNARNQTTYVGIEQQISQGTLPSDSSSITYSYLIPMLKSNPNLQGQVIANAWPEPAAGGLRRNRNGNHVTDSGQPTHSC